MKKDNVEDIYGELETFSKRPPEDLWDNIEARLHPKKKKRRIFFLWGSAAAILIVLVGYLWTGKSESSLIPKTKITDIEIHRDTDISESDAQTTKIGDDTFENNIEVDSLAEIPNTTNTLLNNRANQNQLSDNSESLNKKEDTEYPTKRFNESIISNNEENVAHINNNQTFEKEQGEEISAKTVLDSQKKNEMTFNFERDKRVVSNDSITEVNKVDPILKIEELTANTEELRDTTIINAVSDSKWSVAVLGGLSNTTSNSSIQGFSVNTTPQNDFVYALKLGYAISDRLVVKSGIGKNILGQEINNIRYANSDVSLENFNSENIIDNQSILFFGPQESVNDFSSLGTLTDEGTLQQQFDYIQIPMEVSYNIFRAEKVDLSLGLGGNINFLTNNRAFLDNEVIGESIGANITIFGVTLNSNISYKLAKKTILFIEPSYNYFETPIDNNNQSFQNTQFRLVFGLQYRL